MYDAAKGLLGQFREKAKETKDRISAEIERARSAPNVCPLCMRENLKFEPITYYCHGTSCTGRLRRNANYFCVPNEDYKWCMTCYQELSDVVPIEVGLTVTYKAQLEKRKNDEVNEEPWVHCDGCDRYSIVPTLSILTCLIIRRFLSTNLESRLNLCYTDGCIKFALCSTTVGTRLKMLPIFVHPVSLAALS